MKNLLTFVWLSGVPSATYATCSYLDKTMTFTIVATIISFLIALAIRFGVDGSDSSDDGFPWFDFGDSGCDGGGSDCSSD